LVLAGKRFRGGECDTEEPHHAAGIPPTGPLTGEPHLPNWCGHTWSDWYPLKADATFPSDTVQGLYRIRDAATPGLLYIGQGLVAARLGAHLQKTRRNGHRQGAIFMGAESLECSWVLNDAWLPHQRLELECDLIGSHLLVTGTAPAAQFLG
jgi:hypothetical protein